MLDSNGALRIRAYTAGGALPVKDAIVRISGADEDNGHIVYSLRTDRDGQTDLISLPAPSAEYSLTADPRQFPYSTYDLVISLGGYLTREIKGISVFSGINSVLPINMIPGSEEIKEDYPRGNINTVIPQSHLEK